MIPTAFDYARPATVHDAIAAVTAAGEDAKLLAGGQSLIPVLRLRLAAPTTVIDLGAIADLRGVRDYADAIIIGAMTTHHDVLHDPLVRAHAPLIAQATATVGDRQVRHRGTFGGAIAHADPAGDLPAAALALDATMLLHGPAGNRAVPAREFYVDYLTTALQPDEILTAIRIPKLGVGWSTHYEKFTAVAQAWAVVAVATAVHRSNGTITQARVGLTNMGATALRAHAVEDALAGSPAEREAVTAAAAHAAADTRPPSDLAGSSEYRRQLATVLTRRAVTTALRLD